MTLNECQIYAQGFARQHGYNEHIHFFMNGLHYRWSDEWTGHFARIDAFHSYLDVESVNMLKPNAVCEIFPPDEYWRSC